MPEVKVVGGWVCGKDEIMFYILGYAQPHPAKIMQLTSVQRASSKGGLQFSEI